MCNCNQNNQCNQCDSCNSFQSSCECPVKDLSTDCSSYNGDTLPCSGIEPNKTLTALLLELDAFICNKFTEAINYLSLSNVGNGAEVFKGISNLGSKEIRTIVSENSNLLDVIQNLDTIGIKPGTHRLELNTSTNELSLIVNTDSGDTTLATISLASFDSDTFVQNVDFESTSNLLTIERNNGEPDIILDLSALDKHLDTVNYNSTTKTLEFMLTDNTQIDLGLTAILADAQIKSDYTETDPNSAAFIDNKNPTKSESLGAGGSYTVVVADNNFIIEIDNGANNVTVDLSGALGSSEFFVGFIQKGTGDITFTGADVVPEDLTNVLYGTGHTCALEIINGTKYLIGSLKSV